MAERYNVLWLNYSALKSKLEALRVKFEELYVSSSADKILLADVEQQLEAKKRKTVELSEAKDKWEAEATHLRDWYETPEGFINAATEEKVLMSFLANARCSNC